MPHPVYLTADAERDLEDITAYVEKHDGVENALHVLNSIEQAIQALSNFPDRGTHPGELVDVGIRQYREIFFKPYRIVYQVLDSSVFVMLIADGRRDMQSLLEKRLMRF